MNPIPSASVPQKGLACFPAHNDQPCSLIRGVMVIKQAGKTRAAQRKGALTNWKKTGRTIIKYLRYK